MKKIFFAFMLFFTMNGFSQGYHPIPTNAVWWSENYCYANSFCSYNEKRTVYPVSDIVSSGGYNYVLFEYTTQMDITPVTPDCTESNDTIYGLEYALIRNDT